MKPIRGKPAEFPGLDGYWNCNSWKGRCLTTGAAQGRRVAAVTPVPRPTMPHDRALGVPCLAQVVYRSKRKQANSTRTRSKGSKDLLIATRS